MLPDNVGRVNLLGTTAAWRDRLAASRSLLPLPIPQTEKCDFPSKPYILPIHFRSVNQAFHAELNRWFANTGEVYAATIQIQLRAGLTAKLLAAVSARRWPTLRQLRPLTLLSRLIASISIPDADWREQCAAQVRTNRYSTCHRKLRELKEISGSSCIGSNDELTLPTSGHIGVPHGSGNS